LKTLVISPRFQSWDGSSWGVNAFARTDVVEFSLAPLLERLELDFASTWSAPFPIISSQAQPNSIKTIWLNCDTEEHALWQVLTSSESLEFCQLYFERLLEREGYVHVFSSFPNPYPLPLCPCLRLTLNESCRTVQALLNSTSTMKRLYFTSKYVCPPPLPLIIVSTCFTSSIMGFPLTSRCRSSQSNYRRSRTFRLNGNSHFRYPSPPLPPARNPHRDRH